MKYILVIVLFMGISISAFSVKMDVSGTWNLAITEQDIQNGPGSDLKNIYESSAEQTIIDLDVKGTGNSIWYITVRKAPYNANWHNNFHLFVRRRSDGQGTPNGSISGGAAYQEITENDLYFYEGQKKRQNVAHQFKLTGVSASIPSATYMTTIYYTVVEQ